MANKAAVDFGNSNTVLALWDERTMQSEVLRIPDLSADDSFLIPSLIAYEPDGRFYVGNQCLSKASPEAGQFRWMKRYISLRSPYALRTGSERIDAFRAAEDFLNTVTAASFTAGADHPDELILSVPVESFEHYSEWLLSRMSGPENMHIRLIDEASAAAAGYGLSLHPGDTLLVLDFGGSTLQAVCVSVAEEGETQGRCCRVLGKAGCSLGGMTLDRWLFEYVLKRLSLTENDPRIHSCSGDLLRYCEEVKKRLTESESVLFEFFPDSVFALNRTDLAGLFREHGLYNTLDSVIEEALKSAEDHGLVRDQLSAVVPVGGSCLTPSVRDHLEERFPNGKTLYGEPLGAVARGAAVIAGGMHIYDFIQHNYAIRYTDPLTGDYAFRTIIRKGTKYPQPRVTAPMRLKASFDGQQRFGIAIYEMRESGILTDHHNEIFFDADGAVHVLPLTEAEIRSEQRFWMNERDPMFLTAETVTERGFPQFEISFGIDANKMLLINAKNLISGSLVLSGHPVVRLV